jgi:NADH-quinone oxidoreductase subunit G
MARPQPKLITFTIDGREVSAPENMMLVDAAKLGDVEIPVFCYEPKLGQPVGACRMCLVEIEGIPKLQTGCSTAVKDGMVVNTQSEPVKTAQRGVVEFLLVNHPLDCPVCDKGGECPLQDITFGWGSGISRVVEPKRHFRKPVELSPLVAIDRERCILCYRCARFSQEVAQDHQLVLVERGAHSYISTFDGHPYVAPFSGNIVELCPVGALTSVPYRFRARPWDNEAAGSICTLCPAQCNIGFTVRDERVMRVLGRDHAEVDDGWLCDKGRFAYQAVHADERVTAPMVRDGGMLREVSWERALTQAAAALGRSHGKVAAIAGGQTTSEEGLLLAGLMRDVLGSESLDTLACVDPAKAHRLALPELQATVSDLEHADAVLVVGTEPVDDIPILDLRIRKGVDRRGVKLVVATPRPSSLDGLATTSVRYTPGGGAAFLEALALALEGTDAASTDAAATAAGVESEQVTGIAALLSGAGDDVVILYGQRLLSEPGPATSALERLAKCLKLTERPLGATNARGLLAVPSGAQTNARGLLEAGVAPGYGPGYVPIAFGMTARARVRARMPSQIEDTEPSSQEPVAVRDMAAALTEGKLEALYLLNADPSRSQLPQRPWERAMDSARAVVAHAELLTDALREHADVIFPVESYAEKDGTMVHPDGRLQRVRPAIGRQGATRPGWWVIAELARRLGTDVTAAPEGPAAAGAEAPEGTDSPGVAAIIGGLSTASVSRQLFDTVAIYAGLTPDEISGRGVRWQQRDAAGAFPKAPAQDSTEAALPQLPSPNGALRLGRFRSIWVAPEVELSPALKFVRPRQQAEMAPADAARLGLTQGQAVLVGPSESPVRATVALRDTCPEGTVFLQEALGADSASSLEHELVEIRPDDSATDSATDTATVVIAAGGDEQ